MRVPLTIGDFLNRGALVYGDRTAVVDEPGTAASFGAMTYRQLDARARGMALALDDMGVAHGERVAIVSPNAARINPACSPRQLGIRKCRGPGVGGEPWRAEWQQARAGAEPRPLIPE